VRIEQQPDEIQAGKALAVTAVALVVTVLGVIVAWRLEVFELVRVHPRWSERLPPPPETVGPTELSLFERDAPGFALFARQRAELETFGWVDREAGIAHIPIADAMTLYLERHAAQRGDGAPEKEP
jgi:hypothetical protein